MNILFAGTPEFAARSLMALLESRHAVRGVITQPDRPAGRGLARTASAVKRLAEDRGIRVFQPRSLKEPGVREELGLLGSDAVVTAAYGMILPQQMLDMTPRGALNVHPSLLPRWRGPAPIQRALLAGDDVTGVSIMRMDAGLDTGPVVLREAIPISEADTCGTLAGRLAALGAELIVRALDALDAGELEAVPQAAEGVTYAPKPGKQEFRVDWREDAARVNRRVRAFNPAPGAGARLRGTDLKIWSCAVAAGSAEPGVVLTADEHGLCVACGSGAVRVTELQRPGGKRLQAAEFLRGFALPAGARFEA
ncbi:MAG TPA: methionyl-tRNA formyltransferase [Burkholderiales bacterium]|nr:methionyl-tRNA formyltransferase [Burkholderiales bacterium]